MATRKAAEDREKRIAGRISELEVRMKIIDAHVDTNRRAHENHVNDHGAHR